MAIKRQQQRLSLCLFLFVVLLCTGRGRAWQLPLPGGSSVSFNDGILRIGVEKEDLPPLPPVGTTIASSVLDCIEVRDTGNPKKGYGAFCIQQSIPKHSFLGFYSGKRIVRDINRLEDPIVTDNAGEYVLSLDGGLTFLDGYERAQDRSVFAPAHLNHKDKEDDGCNCLRMLAADQKDVAFFTKRDIHVGEELCFDYGRNYWRGREGDKI